LSWIDKEDFDEEEYRKLVNSGVIDKDLIVIDNFGNKHIAEFTDFGFVVVEEEPSEMDDKFVLRSIYNPIKILYIEAP